MGAVVRQHVFFRGDPPEWEAMTLTFSFELEDGTWVGTCLELGASAFAEHFDEAYRDLVDAVLMHVNEAEDEGYIDAYLRERNVRTGPVQEQRTKGHAWGTFVEPLAV